MNNKPRKNLYENFTLRFPLWIRKLVSLPLYVSGGCLIAIPSAIFFALAVSTMSRHSSLDFDWLTWPVIILLAVMYGLGAALVSFSKSLRALTAQELLKRDTRQPVLYLRSFSDDKTSVELDSSIGGVLSPTRGADRIESLEEILTRTFSKHGPVIAISTPSQGLPPAGAARLPLLGEDTEWQTKVKEIIDTSSYILIIAGFSAGVLWELKQLVLQQALSKTCIIFPPSDLAKRFTAIREVLYELAGIELSVEPPEDLLMLKFTQEATPNYLTGDRTHQGYKKLEKLLWQ